jgi:hypothetical protein
MLNLAVDKTVHEDNPLIPLQRIFDFFESNEPNRAELHTEGKRSRFIVYGDRGLALYRETDRGEITVEVLGIGLAVFALTTI